ncbi:hypothetical protein AVEN_162065-1 [Araneus ventricosus]|uniref:Uncharacterized protein n=1 Tax=Araneus ventricosus TaxID=182803 RepID=A0A4Y2L3C3_ARAVE|nr:hypothetical protein AVEN_162065-1 [Araneus ventricosus]
MQQTPYTAEPQWNRVSNLKPFGPDVGTLPLGHLGPRVRQIQSFSFNQVLSLLKLWQLKKPKISLLHLTPLSMPRTESNLIKEPPTLDSSMDRVH